MTAPFQIRNPKLKILNKSETRNPKRIPRACRVDGYDGCYISSHSIPPNATGLSGRARGIEPGKLAGHVETSVTHHGTSPWHRGIRHFSAEKSGAEI
jgi:hypothetical protein